MTSDAVVAKFLEPKMTSRDHAVDFVFLCKPEDYELFLIEEKEGFIRDRTGLTQLKIAGNYFRRNWIDFLQAIKNGNLPFEDTTDFEIHPDFMDFEGNYEIGCNSALVYHDIYAFGNNDAKYKLNGKIVRTTLGKLSKAFPERY